jgi:hypothetical protein
LRDDSNHAQNSVSDVENVRSNAAEIQAMAMAVRIAGALERHQVAAHS